VRVLDLAVISDPILLGVVAKQKKKENIIFASFFNV
jgi:hypothetical protein